MLIMRPMGLSRERKDRMEEKIYKTMSGSGAMSSWSGNLSCGSCLRYIDDRWRGKAPFGQIKNFILN